MSAAVANTEIEAKFFVCAETATESLEPFANSRVRELISSLAESGFELTKTLDQKDTYFTHCIREGLTTHAKTYLRVRTNDGISSTAMHYKQSDYKWTEIETKVDDGDKMRLLYQNLGMDIDVEVHKIRQVYLSENASGVEIVFDHLVGVGYFLEVEAPDETTLWECAAKLGLSKAQADLIKDKSYADLVREAKA